MPTTHDPILSRPSCRSLALALPLLFGCNGPANSVEAGGEDVADTATEAAAAVGTITKIRGSRGVGSPDLPEGAFLGEGATVHAGQWLELPRGTRVELELSGGQRLRLDENSRLRLPEAGSAEQLAAVELTRGRLVVLSDATPLEVRAAEDRLVVERGEVELHHAGETRHYGVVQGRAILHTAEREIPLGPGASISTPATPSTRPETPPDPTLLAAAIQPSLSLAPLHETAWTAAFEQSERIASDLPEGVGSLVARRAGSRVERQSLRLTEQKVKVTISGRIARTEIEQAFHNDSGQTLEGIYQFPLPADASISDLQLLVGNTWMRGEMLEKRRAERIFRSIVDATVPRDPALLRWEQGGVFKLNIFPIPGKGERRIKIAYTQVLPAVGESLRYRYPMGGSGATATEIGEFDFSVTVDDAGLDAQALAAVSTPMAELQRTLGPAGTELQLALHERDYQPSHELGVDIPLPAEQNRVLAATHRDRDGQGYFMLTLRPELELTAERKPVHYAFVMDRSHGTTPELWAAAEGLSKAMLGTLEPDDRFTLLACDTACDVLPGGLQSGGDAPSLAAVDRFMAAQTLAGASDIGNMLANANATLGPHNSEVEQVVVYLGDGVPTSGALTPDELGAQARENLAHLRIQAVALGARSDLLVLDQLVRQSGGDLLAADARDDLDSLARELRLRAQVPVARDLELELPPGLTDVYPKALPALRPGDSLTLVGKLAEGDPAALRGDVRLHGRGRAGVVDERFQVMLDPEYSPAGKMAVHAHLPRTWAQHEITHLTQTGGAEQREQIIALSREYNVLSRFTALLVLENDRMYREFNVARKAGDKNSWDGKPTEGGELLDTPKKAEDTPTTLDNATTANEAVPSGAAPDPEAAKDARDQSSHTPQATPSSAPSMPSEPNSDFDPLSPNQQTPPMDREDSDDDFGDAAPDFGEFDEPEEEEQSDRITLGGGDAKGAEGQSSSGSSSGPFAPAPPPKKKEEKKSKKKSKPKGKPSAPRDGLLDDDWGGGRGGGGGWSDGGWQQQRQNWPKMVLRDARGPSSSERARITNLQRGRDADPSNRKIHRELVRRATRAGDRNALAFAQAWAAADPDHAPALLALADQLAAAGDPIALRSYASAVEISAFSRKLHERMAKALTLAGDFERACSHRRALVSIEAASGDRIADYVECMVLAGRVNEARLAFGRAAALLEEGKHNDARKRAVRALDSGFELQPMRVHGNPDLRAELRWFASENLDLAFIDRRGRRLSVLRPENIRVREEQDGAQHVELMTLFEVNGTVFIEVTRHDSRDENPVGATLTVKTAQGRRQWNLSLVPGTQRIALTRWD